MILSEKIILKATENYIKNMYGVKPNPDLEDELLAYMNGLSDGAALANRESKKFKGTFYITPRKWGKTTKCIEGFMQDPANSLLILDSLKTREKLIYANPFLMHYRNRIKAAEGYNFRGLRAKNIFIDDYDSFSQTTQMHLNDIIPIICENIFVYTSMIKEPDYDILSVVRNLSTTDINSLKQIKTLSGDLVETIKKSILKMQNSLISNRLIEVRVLKTLDGVGPQSIGIFAVPDWVVKLSKNS